MIALRAISGFGSKGPACFLLEFEGRRILLDCGKGPDDDALPDLSGLERLDAVVITHAHPDHFGALHLLGGLGTPPIYATSLTAEITEAARHGQVRHLPLSGEAELCGLPVLTGRAGHAPGGIWLRIGGPDGLLYTGDFSHEGVLFPLDPFPKARLLVADAAYGNFDATLETALRRLVTIAQDGPLLLPVPAAGRGLEMAILFHEAGLPVGLCPAHRSMAGRLLDHPEGSRGEPRLRLEAMIKAASVLDEGSQPGGVALAATANAETGLACVLVEHWQGRAQIIFTGHRARGTASEHLVQAGKARFVRWNVHPRRRDLDALLEAVAPEQLLPAFLPEPAYSQLARTLPRGLRLAHGRDDQRHPAVMWLG
ncbi:MAG: MBL fold metallo-hydrolase [Devosia sp.]